ncbi:MULTISPECIES: bifunctional DNA-formamidopyrimidine glycosylase/DNA-(apurinic or apyrimidinic site) lyase [unclassified Pseudoclavibacter]|uniref:bifunctional DNA-formamidopyrimidine glycosylase/DNA-(apurinic or apyrimidinic site) lyase n=1 Tax=unclassified Pseudoclavibacter TaxID=2615177 RepID=UPI000CE8010B|nr:MULTISPECIES: bifunctional DNA-formamidopyrimidine glycosylase/DNA-(apurinic or apyrimidinic site) lyase [unclassified Pseudoclavibacter]PPF37586.1 DNA-formamidopyrimidine glycosylase [Pseudoclavibacter sp. AY1H1]PPF77255.1 DNA-formamidopyrimidine glycosylase [Pseudoclavibacter sp. Z016]
MPELPEVEVVRLGLEPAVTGAVVSAVEVLDERSLRRHAGDSAEFVGALEGARISSVSRRGKFLWLPLAGREEALTAHLGMSGQMLLRTSDAPDDRHLRARIRVDGPAGDLVVAFADQRVFGSLAVDRLVPTADVEGERVPSQVAHIARDPLDPNFDDDAWVAALLRRRTGVKSALLDQTLISGIGNIYADEALWRARLHYGRVTSGLSPSKARELLLHVREVFAKALAEGGTSFDAQYVNVNGQAGYFAHSLNVYGRQGKPCPRCGRPIVREKFQNRGSHFCEKCQRER